MSIITAPNIIKAGGAALGLAGGYLAVSGIVRNAYHQDLSGDPRRRIDSVDGGTIEQINKPKGDSLAKLFTYTGAGVAGLGFTLALALPQAASGARVALQGVGGIGLFTFGLGAVFAGQMMLNQYTGAEFYPDA